VMRRRWLPPPFFPPTFEDVLPPHRGKRSCNPPFFFFLPPRLFVFFSFSGGAVGAALLPLAHVVGGEVSARPLVFPVLELAHFLFFPFMGFPPALLLRSQKAFFLTSRCQLLGFPLWQGDFFFLNPRSPLAGRLLFPFCGSTSIFFFFLLRGGGLFPCDLVTFPPPPPRGTLLLRQFFPARLG